MRSDDCEHSAEHGEPITLKITIECGRDDLVARLRTLWREFEQAIAPPLQYAAEFGVAVERSNGWACGRPFLSPPPPEKPWGQIIVSTRLLDAAPVRRTLTLLHECIHLYFGLGPHHQRWLRKQVIEQKQEAEAKGAHFTRLQFLKDRFFNAFTFISYPDEIAAEQFLKERYSDLFSERAEYLTSMRAATNLNMPLDPRFRRYWLFYELLRRSFCMNLTDGLPVRRHLEKLVAEANAAVRESCSCEEWNYLSALLPRLLDVRYDQALDRPEAAYDEVFQRIMTVEPS